MSVRLVTDCCHSTLLVDNPYYANNVVMVMSQACSLKTPAFKPMVRLQCDKDFPKTKIHLLQPFQGRAVDPNHLDDWGEFGTAEKAIPRLMEVFGKEVKGKTGMNFTEFNQEIKVLGLEHYKELV